jgi:hypothetical protein
MPMFVFRDVILLRCVWACDTVLNALTGDETRQATILAAPARLEGADFSIKEQLNMLLKQMKSFLNIGFALNKVNPSEPTKIIQETNIVLKTTNI